MNKSLFIVFLLSILNSIFFYGKSLGINVFLFVSAIIIFIVYTLKSNKKINNVNGLLFITPIILISMTFFTYNNDFTSFNKIIIPALIVIMYIYTISPTYKLNTLFTKFCSLVFEPLSRIGNVYRITFSSLGKAFKLTDKSRKVIKAVLITLPVLILVIILLSNADAVFGSMFKEFLHYIKKIFTENFILRIVQIIVFFTYVGAVINYLLFGFEQEKDNSKESKKVDNYTINVLLSSLGIIYVIFDFIQIKSLMLHSISESINYAQYARRGFFELLVVAFINFIILLITKKGNNEGDKYSKTLSIGMVILTLIIIISSALRMHMYENFYGFTNLRLLVYVTLFTMVILLIPTVLYILNSKINIFKSYLVIITIVYTGLCLFPVDTFITQNNINRYYQKGKLDIEYLENYHTDNIPLLVDLYNNTNDQKIKEELKLYFERFYDFYPENKNKGILEYNLSKQNAQNKLKECN